MIKNQHEILQNHTQSLKQSRIIFPFPSLSSNNQAQKHRHHQQLHSWITKNLKHGVKKYQNR